MTTVDKVAVEVSCCGPYIMAQRVGGDEPTSLLKKQAPIAAKPSGTGLAATVTR